MSDDLELSDTFRRARQAGKAPKPKTKTQSRLIKPDCSRNANYHTVNEYTVSVPLRQCSLPLPLLRSAHKKVLTPQKSAHPKVLTFSKSALLKVLTPHQSAHLKCSPLIKVLTQKCSPLRKVLSQNCSPLKKCSPQSAHPSKKCSPKSAHLWQLRFQFLYII